MMDKKLEGIPWYREVLYAQARNYEYQGKYWLAIEKYKEMVGLGSKEGVREIAKIYIIYTRLATISGTTTRLNFKTLFPWLKKISVLYPEEVFSMVYLFLCLNLLREKEQTRYKSFLAGNKNKAAQKYYKLLLKGEKK